MDKISQLIDSLTLYFQSQSSGLSGLEYFSVYWVPVMQLVVVLLAAIGGIFKYYQTKNKEINEKILSEVYAPLYNYFIKQELFCSLHNIPRNICEINEMPILQITNRKKTVKLTGEKVEETNALGLSRQRFIDVLNNINIGLAGKELYTLLSMYEVVCYLEDKTNLSNPSDSCLDATFLKVQIEQSLRKEILAGYKRYNRWIVLPKIEKISFCEIDGSVIKFNYNIDPNEKQKLKDDIMNNPDSYK